jgi:hypothetical protein
MKKPLPCWSSAIRVGFGAWRPASFWTRKKPGTLPSWLSSAPGKTSPATTLPGAFPPGFTASLPTWPSTPCGPGGAGIAPTKPTCGWWGRRKPQRPRSCCRKKRWRASFLSSPRSCRRPKGKRSCCGRWRGFPRRRWRKSWAAPKPPCATTSFRRGPPCAGSWRGATRVPPQGR